MPVIFENNQIFSLSNKWYDYVLRVTPEGHLENIYFGKPVGSPLSTRHFNMLTERPLTSNYKGVKNLNLNDLPVEYPLYGRSDYRLPAFSGRNADGNSIFSFLYKSHSISSEKPKIGGLPSARGKGSESLTIILEDALLNLELHLYYTVYEDYGVLCKSASILNQSDKPITIDGMASSTLNFTAGQYDAMYLHGTWAREFNTERISIPTGRLTIDSTRGASSAARYPFLAIMDKDANEDYGDVYATTLMYSGNFAMSIEKNEFQNVRVLAGINPFDFKWQLKARSQFHTPEALHVYSSNGLTEMSHLWHHFIRERISPERFKKMPRPSYLNTWEACYFDLSSTKVLSLADKASEIGLDMLVLDDGWFEGRDDDTTSLGDWTADNRKIPETIPWLAGQVKAKGLKFGLWVEPEMVNPKSKLYQAHPDWVLQVPGRTSSLGRNQLTLDLSQGVVVDYLYDTLSKIFSCGDIDYVKWDMNRAMTEIGSTALQENQQGEVAHRYILGLYELLRRLTETYPKIIFENCASGGNRCDLGMLSMLTQTWTSDMCDPIGRLDIIHGASMLLPNEVLASYIGPSPNHQNGRVSSLRTRFLAGVLSAARGLSLNEVDINNNKEELKSYIAFIKASQKDMLGGQFYRLLKTDNEVCWQYNTADSSKIYLCYFHILSAPNLPFKKIKLKGLSPTDTFIMQDSSSMYKGDILMYNGIPLPHVSVFQEEADVTYMDKGDFSSHLFILRKDA